MSGLSFGVIVGERSQIYLSENYLSNVSVRGEDIKLHIHTNNINTT